MPVQRQQKITSLFSKNASESQKNVSEATNTDKKSKKPTPTPVKTDIVISIKTQHMENIISRVKNHEFRKYNISTNIERMWYNELLHVCLQWSVLNWLLHRFYLSAPDQTLRYVAVIRYAYTVFFQMYTCS